jgi:hypothetical protein
VDEYTVVKTVEGLPYGQHWVWYPDANVVALSPAIETDVQRKQALFEVYLHWRESCIQVVPTQRPPTNFVCPNAVTSDSPATVPPR